jgi:hypothetical protein
MNKCMIFNFYITLKYAWKGLFGQNLAFVYDKYNLSWIFYFFRVVYANHLK